ncbi:hypothetical protein BDV96DRAFT_578278 [Lophiotrema nucula]|uniref:Telomeric single stranded DNA binding POT1/Cdc13 domain-containing protein n=1 Tax=Lophiotrema nucula TaxID=690887 RepID=A0A6A5Z2U1_9PLEO|nr:hypothetical protein BDV96DRAFT_578278 [Lophiotrema nucula]
MELKPIAELNPELAGDTEFRGVVTLIWPYSSATRQYAVLLAEPDFRLRRRKGQVRVRFSEASGKAVAEERPQIGDEVILRLKGARFVGDEEGEKISTPGRSLDWELEYTGTVSAKLSRGGNEVARLELVDAPRPPTPASATRHQPPIPGPAAAPRVPPSDQTYASPAFKRIRLSDGPLFQPAFDPLRQEEGDTRARGRPRKSWGDWTTFTYSRRTPSPEKEGLTDDELMSSPVRPSHLPDTPVSPTKDGPLSVAALPQPGQVALSEDERVRQSYSTVADSDVVILDNEEMGIDAVQETVQEDFVRDADYYDLYAGPDEQPPADLTFIYGGDTEPNTSAEDLAAEVQETSDVDGNGSTEEDSVVAISIDENRVGGGSHADRSNVVYPNLDVQTLDGAASLDDGFAADEAPRIVMPPPTLPSLQTEFPPPRTPGLLTPIGKEPQSPVIKPLDSSTLPMPSPFPGDRDVNVTSYLDYVGSSQLGSERQLDEVSNEDGYVEVNFYDSVSSANAPAFHPTHESAFTDVRFTFGMDGTGASGERHISNLPEHEIAHTESPVYIRNSEPDMLLDEGAVLQHVKAPQQASDPFDNPFLQDSLTEGQGAALFDMDVPALEQKARSDEEQEEQTSLDQQVSRPWTTDPFDNPFLQDPISAEVLSQHPGSTPPAEPEIITLSSDVESVHDGLEDDASHSAVSLVDPDERFGAPSEANDAGLHLEASDSSIPTYSDASSDFEGVPEDELAEVKATTDDELREHIEKADKVPEIIDLGSGSDIESVREQIPAEEPEAAQLKDIIPGENIYTHAKPLVGFQEYEDQTTHIETEQAADIKVQPLEVTQPTQSEFKDSHPVPRDKDTEPFSDLDASENEFIEQDHPDIKVESIEDHQPLHSVDLNESFPHQNHVPSAAGPPAVLEIEVPDDGHKLGETHTITVAATGPARNTRSKTKASTMSPSMDETPVPEAKRSTRKSRGSVVSDVGRSTLSPPHTRSGHIFEPVQDDIPQSPYGLRSRSKQISPSSSGAAQSVHKSRIKHEAPLSSPLKHSFASQDVGLPDIHLAPSQDMGASQASQGRFSNVASVKDSFEDDLHSDQSISTAPYSDDHFLRSKPNNDMADENLHSENSQSVHQSERVIDETPATASLAEGESQRRSSLSSALEELPGDVTPKATQVTNLVVYPDLSDASHLRSSPPGEEEPVSGSFTGKYDLRRRQGSAAVADSTSASVNHQSVLNSVLPITPDATQQTFTESQSTLVAEQVEQSMPITPQLTQHSSAGLRSFKKDSQGDVEMEEAAHEPVVRPATLTKTTPRRNVTATDVASTDITPEAHSEDEEDDHAPLELPSIGISTRHGYYGPLNDLAYFLNRSSQHYTQNNPDVLALVTSSTTAPNKAEKGPKHWTTSLNITDPSLWSTSNSESKTKETTVQIFRPYASALPEAKQGDVILLRSFAVKSLNRRPLLVSGEESAWCVWRWSKRVWGARRGAFGELRAREECRGPPVELGDDERSEVEKFRGWWERVVKDAVNEDGDGEVEVEVEHEPDAPRRSTRVSASASQPEPSSRGQKASQRHKRNASSQSAQVETRIGTSTRSKGKAKAKAKEANGKGNGFDADTGS